MDERASGGRGAAAVIFDFDGVIVDSEPMHEAALLRTVRGLGMDFTHARYMEEYIGYDDRDCFRALCRDHGRAVAAEEFARFQAEKAAAVRELIERGEARPFPGTLRLIEEVSRRVPMAICSGALGDEIERILARLGLRARFGVVVSADDVPASKPDPAGYRMTAERLGVEAGRCVVIEDTPTGCRAALAAGMTVAAVCHSVGADAFPAGVALVAAGTAELSGARLLGLARDR